MKRLVDLFVSFSFLIILSPLLLFIVLNIRLKLGSPILFKQKRPGIHGKPFYIYKFRTMTNEKDENGKLLSDEKRLTSLGKLLRKYSLDELPQLIIVIKGDLSLVGPRPLLIKYLDRYTPEQARRNNVKPGITGWAQVNGRNAISWEEKFVLDVWYVDNQSFMLDLKILLLTVLKVIRSEGINQAGYTTMQEFTGEKHYERG